MKLELFDNIMGTGKVVRIHFPLGVSLTIYFEKKWREVFTSAFGHYHDRKMLSVWVGPFGAYIERCSH